MSKIIKCEKGHFYDSDKFAKCPHCNPILKKNKDIKIQGKISDDLDDMVTVAQNMFAGSARKIHRPNVSGETVLPKKPVFTDDMFGKNDLTGLRKIEKPYMPSEDDTEKTVGLFATKSGIDPVVGWIVSVNGEAKGQDYRLIRGFNHIGRSSKMDVCLMHDRMISRDRHCSIVYDDKANSSFLIPGNGTLTYLNGEMIKKPTLIQDGDEVEIGESKFIFISYCKGERVWERD